tara:strand:+ start:278 stop:643 length:366 start_codon:yes stop_codon:yes gene_type:complete
MHQQLDKKKISSILGMNGGSLLNLTLDNVPYNCTKNISLQEEMANVLSGQQGGSKKKSAKKTNKKSKKSMYREYLDKKYSKNQLLKKCKELGIKVTTRKNGMIKPIKKETLVNKIVKIKFN